MHSSASRSRPVISSRSEESPSSSGALPVRQRGLHCDAVQPCREPRARWKEFEIPPGREESLLEHLFSVANRDAHVSRDRVDGVAVPGDERRECYTAASPRALGERLVADERVVELLVRGHHRQPSPQQDPDQPPGGADPGETPATTARDRKRRRSQLTRKREASTLSPALLGSSATRLLSYRRTAAQPYDNARRPDFEDKAAAAIPPRHGT